MAWTGLTFTFGSLLTATKMTQIQDNFQAMARGEAGAPPLWTSALWANANPTGVQSFCFADSAGGSGAYSIGAGLTNDFVYLPVTSSLRLLQLGNSPVSDAWYAQRGGKYVLRLVKFIDYSGTPNVNIAVYVNGVAATSTYSFTSNNSVHLIEVDSVAVGDAIQLYGRFTSAGSSGYVVSWYDDIGVVHGIRRGP